jgi:hypothetical protein
MNAGSTGIDPASRPYRRSVKSTDCQHEDELCTPGCTATQSKAALAVVKYLLERRNTFRHLSKRHFRRLLSGILISVLISTGIELASDVLTPPPGPPVQAVQAQDLRRKLTHGVRTALRELISILESKARHRLRS